MNIFEQDHYKTILNFLIKEKRKTQKGLSRKLAEHLRVHATLVSQVLTGEKDFTEEQIFLVCEFLGLGKWETQYIWILLQIERAGTEQLKNHYREIKLQVRKEALQISKRVKSERQLTEGERAIFYSSWIYSAVHLSSTLRSPLTFDGICQKFRLPPAKAREILDFLLQIRMLKDVQGKLQPGSTMTHLERKSPFIAKYHTTWRLKAIEHAENLADEELMYSVNVSLSRKDFSLLREELMQFIQKFLKTVKESPAEDIAQFNLDFFWIR